MAAAGIPEAKPGLGPGAFGMFEAMTTKERQRRFKTTLITGGCLAILCLAVGLLMSGPRWGFAIAFAVLNFSGGVACFRAIWPQ